MTVIIKSQSPIVFYDAETREIHQIHSFSKDGRNALSGFLISLDRRWGFYQPLEILCRTEGIVVKSVVGAGYYLRCRSIYYYRALYICT